MFNKEIHPLNQLEFPDTREKWKNAPIEITINQLLIDGHPVMETWEDAYMKQLAAIAASSGGVVLEVGFGLGISAAFIQEHSVSEHWIIEANASVFKNLLEFNEIYPNVKPLFGFCKLLPLYPMHRLMESSLTRIQFHRMSCIPRGSAFSPRHTDS
ncbi:MAG: hypothetical protein IPP63_08255 [Chloracidobacterium sp.]|nr:hypothetical protein [Chloracidobacterium sp.]